MLTTHSTVLPRRGKELKGVPGKDMPLSGSVWLRAFIGFFRRSGARNRRRRRGQLDDEATEDEDDDDDDDSG